MVKYAFDNVKVKGISTVVPKEEKSLLEDKELYNGNLKKIQRVINSSGFLKRRIADKNVTTADLCFQAAKDLIKNLDINKKSIDALLFVSYTPDYLMPATSYILHNKLSLSENCLAFDIPQACSGYIIGLYQSSMLLNSGCKRILLLVGDTFSKYSDMFIDHTAPIFGDAGSATLIDYDVNSEKTYFNLNTYSSDYDALICENGGFRNIPKKEDFYKNENYIYKSKMNGGKIFDFTMNNVAPNIKELLEYANVSISKIDQFIFHQANKFILENIIRKLGKEDFPLSTETLTNFGNQCGASIPCTISNIYKDVITSNNLKCLLSGFGVGLSIGSAIINLDNIYCSNLNEYKIKN